MATVRRDRHQGVRLPERVSEDGVKATDADGVLEIRVPLRDGHESQTKKIPVARA